MTVKGCDLISEDKNGKQCLYLLPYSVLDLGTGVFSMWIILKLDENAPIIFVVKIMSKMYNTFVY